MAAWAGGPILVDTDDSGEAIVWRDGVVTYNPETSGGDPSGGELGRLTNQDAVDLLDELFAIWESLALFNGSNAVTTVDLVALEDDGLGNVDVGDMDDHFTYCPPAAFCVDEGPPFVIGSAESGESPILFDDDGAMTDRVWGVGASLDILGFAGPRVITRIGNDLFISEAQAVLNGRFIDCPPGAASDDPCQTPEAPLDSYKAAIFHELGHVIGLDHTQVNFDLISDAVNGDAGAASRISTMLPLFIGAAQLTPHFDDIVALSTLYPTAAFQSDFCQIQGTVFRSDGVTPLQGVNVIVRRQSSPEIEAASFVSGALFTGPTNCTAAAGDYVIGGLRPGISYTLEVEAIASGFVSGSSIEPCDPPLSGFAAAAAAGTFSCQSGGDVIVQGTATSTDFVTTKGSSSEGDVDGETKSVSSSSCQLLPDAQVDADGMAVVGLFLAFALLFGRNHLRS